MPLKLNSSGGGSVTVQEPSTASNVTFNLPSETATAIYSNASGNVGIGTSSPDGNLQVFKNAASSIIRVTSSTTGVAGLDFGDTDAVDRGQVRYFNNGDYLLFATAATERARIDSSGNFQFNSGYGSVATAFGCRAWVNFNGTGTVAIRASGNVSSITDNGTGDYTVNFTTAMPDANYSIGGMVQDADTSIDTCVVGIQNPGGLASSTARLRTTYGASTSYDFTIVCVSVFR
jgi:hypothetical protein